MDDVASQQELDAGRGYEALFVPALFAPWTAHLIGAADVIAGQCILDVACGTGILARHALKAVGETGHVAGLDPAPGMIATAREVEPRIDWVVGRAEDVPFGDGTFDAVLSQFGMMFFQDRQRAVGEMYRVLVPGGRLAIAVWNALDHNPAYRDLSAALEGQIGSAAGDALRLPFCMGDAGTIENLLARAGFADIGIATRTEQATFPSLQTMLEADLRGWLPLFDICLTEDRIADVIEKSVIELAQYGSATGEAVFPTSAHIVTAVKP